jgi:DNA-binding NtrC family response regulator
MRRTEPPTMNGGADGRPAGMRDELAELEKRRILEALDACAGNQTRAARSLGISRRTLLNRLDQYQIARPRKN